MVFSEQDHYWMQQALAAADQALQSEDVPIGAVAVLDDQIIGIGFNQREQDQDPTAHAEMIALRQAAQFTGYWRLENVSLYCTLEPCAMCAGAMVLARLPRLVYAARDPKAGAAGSVLDILRDPRLNHQVLVASGLYEAEASEKIKQFFRNLRAQGQK